MPETKDEKGMERMRASETKKDKSGIKERQMLKTGENGTERDALKEILPSEAEEQEREDILEREAAETDADEVIGVDAEADVDAGSAVPQGSVSEQRSESAPRTVILQVDHNADEDLEEIDLVNVARYMGSKWKFYAYLFVVVVCIGFVAAVLSLYAQKILGGESSATAVITFNFDGVDKGLDPNGGIFDVTQIKSTEVINMALEDLGWSDIGVETIRANITVVGVIPDSVKQQISVINTVAEDAVQYYTNIENLDYFPTRYTVTLKRCNGMDGEETSELLNAILLSYRQYFMDTYANTSVLGLASSVLDIEGYDYLQASDMIGSEIDTIQSYVDAKAVEASDFRASSTGLSFSDLSAAIDSLKRIDLNNFISYVQSNNLTKDAGVQVDYYNYQIKQYTFDIQELQTQLNSVDKMITEYEKSPVIVMSSQESVMETAQTDEYYNSLLEQKLSLNKDISELNTKLNEAYAMVNALNTVTKTATEKDYSYADSLLEGLVESVESWADLTQRTTEEYFEAGLFADAYRIAIPAQYSVTGGMGLGELAKRMLLFGGFGGAMVIVLWGISGLKDELKKPRTKVKGA